MKGLQNRCFVMDAFVLAVVAASQKTSGTTTAHASEQSNLCSLNGDYNTTTAACSCDPAWTGEVCDQLNVQPIASRDVVGYRNSSGFNSWGGNAIFADGKWHLFAAQFLEQCTLEHWGTNSVIIRAESTEGPQGPFQYAETVVGAFAHNPTVRQTPDGTFVLYMIGDGQHAPGSIVNCSGNSSLSTRQSKQPNAASSNTMASSLRASRERMSSSKLTTAAVAAAQRNGFQSSISVTWSQSVYGPWPAPVPVNFADTSPQLGRSRSNPSPFFTANGGVMMAFTAAPEDPPPKDPVGVELIGVAYSAPVAAASSKSEMLPAWVGPFSLLNDGKPVFPTHPWCLAGAGEDPFLWKDRRGFKLLTHGMCPTGLMQAHYAYSSSNGSDWTVSPRETYSYDVSFADGSSKFFDRVERPQLSFALPQLHQNDDDGTAKLGPFDRPTHLWNGVCEGFGCLGLLGQKAGPSFTLSRPLGPPG